MVHNTEMQHSILIKMLISLGKTHTPFHFEAILRTCEQLSRLPVGGTKVDRASVKDADTFLFWQTANSVSDCGTEIRNKLRNSAFNYETFVVISLMF